ncbi:GNAT family N-acetyltransferase [Vibrio diazotrophicus]|uniref:GNAT family N-acetyltransferase n=1 Tax=Vibrio diazotrophicus TaxID=685 RepID=UPI0022AE5FF8|nr:GNAT family N-acetyltransferase [Vibrio diazotrophicus]MCZ4373404.1 GNAT family N-acetyltransferase [Vibrio diazotrophicus]
MDKEKVMQEYNKYERKNINAFNGTILTTREVVKFVSDDTFGSYISYFDFSEEKMLNVIHNELEFFRQRNIYFEWKMYSTDSPCTLDKALVDNGFTSEGTESFMALDLHNIIISDCSHSAITEVYNSSGIRDAIEVQEQVWGKNLEWQYHYLLKLKSEVPEDISIYVVYINEQPVASAWVTFNAGSPFAGIWGGSTLKAFRNKGYYTMLLNIRIHEAIKRGKQYLIIDASDMSRPIVEKYGFEFIATTTGFVSPRTVK